MIEPQIKRFGTLKKIAWGAFSIAKFAKDKGIIAKSLEAYVLYLLLVLKIYNLAAWHGMLKELELCPQDPLPSEIDSQLQPELRNDFFDLIGYSIEIAWSDMYCADSAEPTEMLLKCFDILQKHRVEIPNPEEIGLSFDFDVPMEVGGWGETLSEKEYDVVIQSIQAYFPEKS